MVHLVLQMGHFISQQLLQEQKWTCIVSCLHIIIYVHIRICTYACMYVHTYVHTHSLNNTQGVYHRFTLYVCTKQNIQYNICTYVRTYVYSACTIPVKWNLSIVVALGTIKSGCYREVACICRLNVHYRPFQYLVTRFIET